MGWLASDTGMARTSLYRSLSRGARPEFKTIQAVLKAIHIKLDPAVQMKATCEQEAA